MVGTWSPSANDMEASIGGLVFCKIEKNLNAKRKVPEKLLRERWVEVEMWQHENEMRSIFSA